MQKKTIYARGPEFGSIPEREVRTVSGDLIEEYLTIYLNAYPAFKNIGDEGRSKYRARYLDSMKNDRNINFCGLFENGQLIALAKLIDFSMNAFGKMIPATGLMSLAVHPMHKKKGAGLDMVRFFEKYTVDSGASVSMLLPFRIDFYRKMGYGYGSKLEEYRIPTVNLPECRDTSMIEFLGSDDLPRILECQAAFASRNHGMLLKFEDEIRDMASDSDSRRIGYVQDGKLRGYMIYEFVCESDVNYTLNRIEVKEFAYEDGKVLQTLLGFLRNQSDLARTVVIRTGEEDFYHILPSAQDTSENYIDFGFLQTNIGAIGTMYKIVDLEGFITASSHRKFIPVNLSTGFDYYDELAHSEKTFNIAFETDESGKTARWHVIPKDAPCDARVKCNLADLSALLMGSCRLASLLRLGGAEISDDAYADMLDSLLCCKQKPWTNTDY